MNEQPSVIEEFSPERYQELEKQVHEQYDEIVCLKSSIADLLRRVSVLENMKLKESVLPPSKSGDPKPATKSIRPTVYTNKSTELRMNKTPRKSSYIGRANSPAKNKISGPISQGKEKIKFIPEEGIVKTFLRGRPINSYLPTSFMEDYDVKKVVEQPEENLRLEWVYGYRGRDCRDNIHCLPTGEIVYFVAAVVVLYNMEGNSQRHYLGHTDDIKCLAIHPDRITLASGQVTGHEKTLGKAHIRIWNSISLQTMHVLGGNGEFERAVCTLGFSKTDGGAHLVAIDESNDHVISVWNWEKQTKITETKSSTEQILSVEYSPVHDNSIVTIGKNHIAFWSLENNTLSKKNGLFDKFEKSKIVICMVFTDNGDLLTGDSSGNIYLWAKDGHHVVQALDAVHESGVFSLCFTKDGTLISGGKDRRLIYWDRTFQQVKNDDVIPEWFGSIRTIIEGPGGMLVIGTTKNNIIKSNLDSNFSAIVTGHQDELWGLDIHCNKHQFITAGNDNQVSLWDALARKLIWTTKVNLPIACVSFYPEIEEENNEHIVALGSVNGKWIVMDLIKHEVISVHGDAGGEQIQTIEYSPDGKYLAVGSRDNNIYIYQVLDKGLHYTKVGRCSGHSSFVLHIDWSKDSSYIRTMSGDYAILYWTPADCQQEPMVTNLRDLEWASHNITLGWDVTGIWPEGADGTDINCCDRSKGGSLLTTGCDSGLVKLFRYPSTQLCAKTNSYRGHSSHVTNVKFMFDDSRLISIGGKDTAVFQWEILN